jgi:hypothetical protein
MYRLTCCTLIALCLATGVLALLNDSAAQDDKPQTLTLTAIKVDEAPALKAEVLKAWEVPEKISVPTHYDGRTAGPNVELRALHDGEYIYVMARWEDTSKSVTKAAWEYKEGKWQAAEGDEDRIAIAVNGNVEGFAEEGCTKLCHYGAMGTADEKQRADLWHWKAARGGLNGYSDDQNFNGGEKGRADDAGKSAYEGNANAEKTAPKWVWKDDADHEGAFTAESSVDLPAEFKADAAYSVPSNRLRTPDKSRGDIECAAAHKDGWWTVVFKRKLETGNEDDSALKVGEVAHIALAVLNNSGVKTGKEHAKSGPIKLSVEK